MPYISGYLIEGGIDNDLPRPPGHVDNSLPGYVTGGPIVPPAPPIIWPLPPRNEVTPPIYLKPPVVDNTLPPGSGGVDNTLPVPPGVIYPPPGPGASGKYLALVVVAVGSTGQITYAWTVVDPSLTVGWPLPNPPVHIDNAPIQPSPSPKR